MHRVWAEIDTSSVRHNLLTPEVDSLGVGDSGEALELRDAGVSAPILIVGGIIPGEMPRVVANDIEVNLQTV